MGRFEKCTHGPEIAYRFDTDQIPGADFGRDRLCDFRVLQLYVNYPKRVDIRVDLFESEERMKSQDALRLVKLLHTMIWVFFVGCILGIPVFSYAGDLRISAILIAVVTLEVIVIVANKRRCPLTSIAARYTTDRRDNFDIYLPEWLARYNQVLFGSLFLIVVLYTILKWWIGVPP